MLASRTGRGLRGKPVSSDNSDLDEPPERKSPTFSEALQKTIEYLQDQPLLLFVLATVIVLAASGPLANIWLIGLLALLTAAGMLAWVFLEVRKSSYINLSKRYGITIDEPIGDCHEEKNIVRGRYVKKPPDNSLRLFTVSMDGGRCWLQSVAKITGDGRWEGDVYLGGSKPNYEIKIVAAIVGPSTQMWWNYYRQVSDVMRKEAPNVKRPIFEGWPPDAAAQAAVYVTRVFDAAWNEKRIFNKFKQSLTPKEFEVAQAIFDWMRKDGRSLVYGDGQEFGSVLPVLRPNGIIIKPIYLSTDGKVWLQFAALEGKPVFGSLERRRELMNRFGAVKGAGFVESDLGRYPSIPLGKIAADPDGLPKMLAALNWMDDQIAAAG